MTSVAGAWAQSQFFEVDGIYYTITDEVALEVEVGTSDMHMSPINYSSAVVVPERVSHEGNTYRVTGVGMDAFGRFERLTSVVLPDGVTRIGMNAFFGCTNLTSVNIPDGVTSIGEGAFSRCSSLATVNIPSGVTSIEPWTFQGCSSLTSVTIGSGVERIGEHAFEGSGIYTNESNWEDGLLYIGDCLISGEKADGACEVKSGTRLIADGAFRNCSGLTSVSIPAGVTSIGAYAFRDCSGLTSVNIPGEVERIGEYAFEGSGIYTDENNWENGLLYIDNCLISGEKVEGACEVKSGTRLMADGAFTNCSGLASVVIPDGVTRIGQNAFASCGNLALVTLPAGVTSIGRWAFVHCRSLTSIALPASVTSIEANAFDNSGLVSIVIPEGVTSIEDGVFTYCDSLTSVVIPGGVTSIGENAFYRCGKLASIDLPAGVTSIGRWAFYRCSSLASIALPDGVTSIGESAFSQCSNLVSMVLPDRVTSIGNFAFNGCGSLASVTVGSGLTRIGEGAFEDCTALTSLPLPYGLTSIGRYAFRNCAALTSLTLPDGLASIGVYAFEGSGIYNTASNWENGLLYIGDYLIAGREELVGNYTVKSSTQLIADGAFAYCNGITSITLPGGLTRIGEEVFMSCRGLTSMTIPGGVTHIGDNAFSACTGLTSITLPARLTHIGSYAFQACLSLPAITLPAGLAYIGEGVFDSCDSLVSVVIPDSLTRIRNNVFAHCRSLTSVTLPAGLKRIEEGAFTSCEALQEIHCQASTPPSLGGDLSYQWGGPFGGVPASVVLYVPCGAEGAYLAAEGWSKFGTAIGVAPQVQVSANDAGMGTATVTQPAECMDGVAEAVIEATPAEGYRFVRWSDGNTDNPRTLTVTEDMDLTAQFAINTYQVTVNADNAEHGSVTGSGEYNHGATATIEAVPAEGYHFVQWSDGNTDNPRELVVTEDVELTAEFAPSMTTGLDNTVGLFTVTTDHNGNILVHCAADSALSVYTVQGVCLYRGTAEADPTIIPVPSAGLYVVMVEKEMAKVVVK